MPFIPWRYDRAKFTFNLLNCFERTIVLQIPRILLASPPTLRLLIAISPGAEAEAYAGDIDVVIIVVLAHPAPIIEAACDKNDLRRHEFKADGSV